MEISLLITTFNRPDGLDLVLRTVANQSRIPDEIIVCDDGSSWTTAVIVERWLDRLPIQHAWHPDRGFRAARARNLGLAKSDAEYVILIDGDCLLPPQFVENHVGLAKKGFLVAGGRHMLSTTETDSLLNATKSIDSAFAHWKFRSLSLGPLRDICPDRWDLVRTCNLGLYREDIVAVGGFDESYMGWGREDSDFVVRLMHLGIKARSARLSACVAHLFHSECSRSQFSKNDDLFQKCLQDPSLIRPKSSVIFQP